MLQSENASSSVKLFHHLRSHPSQGNQCLLSLIKSHTAAQLSVFIFPLQVDIELSGESDCFKLPTVLSVWFHVDKLSSGHVYLRLHKGEKIEDIPKEVLMDCAHLVKANSIQGCKMNNVNVVYTPWSNLKKTADMDVGQIGFHRQKDVKIVTVEKKVNEILNRLEKTKMERFPDLAAEKEGRDREERNEKKAQIQEMKRKEKEEMKKKREMDELRSYSSLMKVENMSSNQDGNDSDEFM
uniref:Coiled-coil domain-containing protein 25 n=1 Tax=Oryctolagus cuniculus TaxID=9986 RepID=A0A5F9DAI6_RABIT